MRKTVFVLLLTVLLMATTGMEAAAEESSLLCRVLSQEDNLYDVAVEFSGKDKIAMMQFCIYYDSAKLSCTGVEVGAIFQGNYAPTVNSQTPGEIALSWDSLTSLQREGTLLLLHMQLLGDEPASLSFGSDDETVFAGEDFTPIRISCTGCQIEKTFIPAVGPAADHTPTSDPPIPYVSTSEEPAVISPAPSPKVVATPDVVQHVLDDDNALPVLSEGESNGLTLPEEQVVIHVSESFPMTIQEDEKNLVWSSSDERIATVEENGMVSAHEEGTAIISVSTEEGTDYASCAVKVVPVENEAEEPEVTEGQEIPQQRADDTPQPLQERENLLTADKEEPAASPETEGSNGVHLPANVFIVAVLLGIIMILLIIRSALRHSKK